MAITTLLRRVTDYYLNSPDFNGLPARNEAERAVIRLVRDGQITVSFGQRHPNPNIKALDPTSIDDQVERIRKFRLQHACLYPSLSHLRRVLKTSAFQGKPFSLKLALGEPQLKHYPFDTSVLETYRMILDITCSWMTLGDASQ